MKIKRKRKIRKLKEKKNKEKILRKLEERGK
jgi:hypothetical protein